MEVRNSQDKEGAPADADHPGVRRVRRLDHQQGVFQARLCLAPRFVTYGRDSIDPLTPYVEQLY